MNPNPETLWASRLASLRSCTEPRPLLHLDTRWHYWKVCISSLLEIEREIDRYDQALGRATISLARLEKETKAQEEDKILLEQQLEYVEQRIRESQVTEFDAGLVR